MYFSPHPLPLHSSASVQKSKCWAEPDTVQLTPQPQEVVQLSTNTWWWWWCRGAVSSFHWWWTPSFVPAGCSAPALFSFPLQGLCPAPWSVFLNHPESLRELSFVAIFIILDYLCSYALSLLGIPVYVLTCLSKRFLSCVWCHSWSHRGFLR